MSSDTACLALRLEGPLQSWGTDSQYNRRATSLMPSKSAVLGLMCAAMGLERGSGEEHTFLARFTDIYMLAVHVPRKVESKCPVKLGRMVDFHTIQGTRKAKNEIKDCHITRRHYVEDASFRVFFSGDKELLENVGAALRNPIWGLWLGRKCNIPSSPVFAGIFPDEAKAITVMLGSALDSFTHMREVVRFEDGSDSLRDQAVSFLSEDRQFTLRRVRYHPARTGKEE
jgi:CRISPR system Cascade subunit CasD